MISQHPLITRREPRHAPCGFTLVELLVAMTIGFFLTAGLLQLYASNRQSYRATESLARIQEQGRFILDYLANEIRPAGGKGSCVKSINTLLDTSDSVYTADRFDLTGFVRGWDNSKGNDPNIDDDAMANYVAGTDVMFIKHAAMPANVTVPTPPSASSTTVNLTAASGLHRSILVLSAPLGCDMFQNSDADTATTLSSADAGTHNPNNTTGGFKYNYGENMEVLVFHSRLYFVATNAEGRRALWERRFDRGDYEDIELVTGVHDMQISYGLDTNADGRLDSYSTAPADWSQVAAIKIELLLVGEELNMAEAPMSLPFNNGVFTAPAGDRRLYQTFTTTVGLRNRIL